MHARVKQTAWQSSLANKKKWKRARRAATIEKRTQDITGNVRTGGQTRVRLNVLIFQPRKKKFPFRVRSCRNYYFYIALYIIIHIKCMSAILKYFFLLFEEKIYYPHNLI